MPQANVTFFRDPTNSLFTAESQCSAWERQFAFGSLEPTALIQRAQFDRLANTYVRPSDANLANSNVNINGRIHYFCADTGFTDKRGGLEEWTREVATLPANFSDSESYPFPYPGYHLEREGFTRKVTSKLQHDFFLVGNVSQGANYSSALDIPQTTATEFAWATLTDGTILDGYLANTNANAGVIASTPTLANYKANVAADLANANSYTIEAEDSTLEHLRGPIWMRTRRFVKAR